MLVMLIITLAFQTDCGTPNNREWKFPWPAPAPLRSLLPSTASCYLIVAWKLLLTRYLPHPSQLAIMDRASQVLAQGFPDGVPKSIYALADHSYVPRTTLQHRARSRRSGGVPKPALPLPWEAKPFIEVLNTTGCSQTRLSK